MSQFALTPKQLDDLRHLLEQQMRQLRAALRVDLHADDSSHISITPDSDADWTTADVESDSLIAKAGRDAKELSETTAAIDKLLDGSYGICEACGEAIGYPRLLAYPSARRCLACQTAAEAREGDKAH
jgi:RNA polymerase-binding protein DksA